MYEIQDIMRILGWTEHQVRVRLDEFRSILAESLRRGDHNRILLDGNGLAILQRVKELEARGHTLKEIKTAIETELRRNEFVPSPSGISPDIQTDRNDRNREASPSPGTEEGATAAAGGALGLLVEELRRQVEAWRQEAQAWREQAEAKDKQIVELLAQLKELQQKALPPARPTRTGWFRFWRRRTVPPSEA